MNIISVHSDMTSGDVKMNFGLAEHARYEKYIPPIYRQFLQKCYSPAECRARALPEKDSFGGWDMDMDSLDLRLENEDFYDVERSEGHFSTIPWNNPSAASVAAPAPSATIAAADTATSSMQQPADDLASTGPSVQDLQTFVSQGAMPFSSLEHSALRSPGTSSSQHYRTSPPACPPSAGLP
ncbi:hypothetical protein BDZ97DRAFT_699190 [Flammula alnicola]|nr:hypothetical protein BDZ97DRAFT_699190 [Flammula alnicola]